jgi:uncharacterized protein (TIGR02246 family)
MNIQRLTETSEGNDRQAIEALMQRWLAAVQRKDIASLLDMITDDAVFLPPGLPPVRGKREVEALYGRFFPQFSRVEQTASMEELIVAGDWAFSWGFESFVLQAQAGGPEIRMQGKGMSVLQRQPDGSWKYARGINNTLPQAQPKVG